MTMKVHELVRLNNEGIDLLKQQKFYEAVNRFTDAMQMTCDHTFPEDLNEGSSEQRTIGKPLIQGVNVFECYSWEESSSAASYDGDSAFDLYERAFALSRDFDPIKNDVLFDSVLLYNLAFAYHRLALTQVKHYTKNMMSALRCYKFGLQAVRHNTHPAASEYLFVIALAYLNNMGHAFAHFGRPKDASSCRDMLSTLVESHIPESISQDDEDFFYFGQFYRRMGCSTAAAPAA